MAAVGMELAGTVTAPTTVNPALALTSPPAVKAPVKVAPPATLNPLLVIIFPPTETLPFIEESPVEIILVAVTLPVFNKIFPLVVIFLPTTKLPFMELSAITDK